MVEPGNARREQRLLTEMAQRLEAEPPQAILQWAVARYHPGIVLASGFGLQSVAQIHMLHDLGLLHQVEVFYLDTDLLFDETHETRRRLEAKYGFEAVPVRSRLTLEEQEAEYGPNLWETDPTACCRLRKVEPLRRFLRGRSAWITGLRRNASQTRASVPVVMWDEVNQLAKINPMACMDEQTILGYIHAHEVPYNPLYDRGYRSIGCTHCTRPVAPGESERAGRWAGRGKTECGIHIDGRTIRDEGSKD